MKKIHKILIAAGVLIAAAAVIFLVTRNAGSSADRVFVQKVSALTGVSGTQQKYAGVVEAQQTLEVKADSGRSIDTIYVSVGEEVNKGTPLFRYDVTEASNKIESLSLDIEGLNNEIAVLKQSGDSTETQLQISRTEIQIRQYEAEIEGYRQQVANADVTSDIAGIVKSVNPSGTDSTGNTVPIVTVSETGEFRVRGKVSEQTISALQSGTPVIVRSRVDESKIWKGTVTQIGTEPEAAESSGYMTSGETASSYRFYVTLENTEGLMLGQHVYIEPDIGQSETVEGVFIYQDYAVTDESGNTFVWVGENGKLRKRTVTLGEADPENYTVEVLSGLSQDDLIAWPDETLKEGMPVTTAGE